MPEIGEIKRGKEIGKTLYSKYIWQACLDCGKQRWVILKKGKPFHLLCVPCSHKREEYQGKGSKSAKWKGGRHKLGPYIGLWLSRDDFFYPMVRETGYVREHRLVMAKSLGRCLQPWEIVHHKNGIKDDNRIENLQLVTDDRHKQISILENRIKLLEKRVLQLEIENIGLRQSTSAY